MNKQNLNVWGRKFELEVIFDCYTGEEASSVQKNALAKFLTVADCLIEEARQSVDEYCFKCNAEDIGVSVIENVFKYVIPKSIYIQRTTDKSRVVGLMCAYKFDADNGIAVVFRNERFDKVAAQNVIL